MKEFADLFKIMSDFQDSMNHLISDVKEIKSNSNLKQHDGVELPINIEEASRVTNLAVATIYGKKHRGEIPFIKKGGKLYFYRSQLIDWLNKSE